MATNVLMPQLGESIAEGTIVRWVKAVGDRVDRDEPLFEISTDKIDAEIPSPTAGVLLEILATEGETVPIDSIVALIGQEGETSRETSGTSTAPLGADPKPAIATTGVQNDTPRGGRLSPMVRRIARQHDIDVTKISGTGSGGRVTKDDVLRYVERTSETAEGRRSEPMSIMRRRIADHMLMSRRTSAHVHTVFDVDFTHVDGLRRRQKSTYEKAGVKLTYLSFIAKAVVDAVPQVPIVNASLQGETIVYRDNVNLGIAVALDGGLIVPVIKRTQDASVVDLSRAIADVADRARAKRLTPDDVEGGTFTVTNPGSLGSILGMPIINQPQLAILGVGAVEKRPVVVGDVVVVRLRAYLTLGFDHRVIDGAVADQFMAVVKRNIEQFDETLLTFSH